MFEIRRFEKFGNISIESFSRSGDDLEARF
jgi:hypothetical protein